LFKLQSVNRSAQIAPAVMLLVNPSPVGVSLTRYHHPLPSLSLSLWESQGLAISHSP
jgi:hypothetical protein